MSATGSWLRVRSTSLPACSTQRCRWIQRSVGTCTSLLGAAPAVGLTAATGWVPAPAADSLSATAASADSPAAINRAVASGRGMVIAGSSRTIQGARLGSPAFVEASAATIVTCLAHASMVAPGRRPLGEYRMPRRPLQVGSHPAQAATSAARASCQADEHRVGDESAALRSVSCASRRLAKLAEHASAWPHWRRLRGVTQGGPREEDSRGHDGNLQEEIGASNVDNRNLLQFSRCIHKLTDLEVQTMVSCQACEAHQRALTLRVLETAASKGCRQLLQRDGVRYDGDADARRSRHAALLPKIDCA
eukprot:scaffold1744_cov129-Isochrysis_galbana.AAC.9